MDRLLIIADDFTGALDTGVQFASYGALTSVVTNPDCDYLEAGDCCQVLVVDVESRHMTADGAYGAVFRAASKALDSGFTYIYKKTDSALRGNVGAELAAVLDAARADSMAVFPSFPEMGRITRNGVQYIDGVPVAESVFGQDPFEPVRHSSVKDIIGEQTDKPVILHPAGDTGRAGSGIHVYDAVTDEDLRRAASALKSEGGLRLMAGCAGFASVLPELLEMTAQKPPAPPLTGKLLTICGSVNLITTAQMDAAERAGALRLSLSPDQKLAQDWAKSPDGRQIIAGWTERIRKVSNAIIECGVNDRSETSEKAKQLGLTLRQTRERIADAMGGVLQQVLDMGLDRDILVTGGDTLLAFMKRVGLDTLTPLGEPVNGVVLSRIRYGGRRLNLMTKSGGFGQETLLTDLAAVRSAEAVY